MAVATANTAFFDEYGSILMYNRIGDSKRHVVNDAKIEHDIAESGDVFFLQGEPYVYSDGVFVRDSNRGVLLKSKIRGYILPELLKSNVVDRVYKLFGQNAKLYISEDDVNKQPKHWVNFRNGYYDPIEKVTRLHKPDYRSLNMIPLSYNPDVQPCAVIDDWLESYDFTDDELELLLEFFGYCMTTDTGFQKFLVLTGSGGNGKSVFISFLESILGDSTNCASVSLQKLTDRFSAQMIHHKLLNAFPDLPSTPIEDTSAIKLLTGEDLFSAEKKYIPDMIQFKSYGKVLFSANQFPLVLNDPTDSFYRRLLVIPFRKKPDPVIPNLLDSLKAEGKEYFVRLCMEALHRLYERGSFIEPQSSVDTIKQFRHDSDTVQTWIDYCCETSEGAKTKTADAFMWYRAFCNDEGREPLGKTKFRRALENKGFYVKRSNGEYYSGLNVVKQSFSDEI